MNQEHDKQSVTHWMSLPGADSKFVITDATTGMVERGGDPGASGHRFAWRRTDDNVQVRWPAFAHWVATATFGLGEDGPRMSSIEFASTGDGAAFGAEILRQLGLRDVHRQMEIEFRQITAWLDLPEAWERKSLRVRRPGRQGMSDIELAQWAQRYVEATENQPKRPVAWMAEEYGWSVAGIRATLERARRKDLLTKAVHGVAGGSLTKKAREILGIDQ